MTTEEKEEKANKLIEIDGEGMIILLFMHVIVFSYFYVSFVQNNLFYSQHPYLFWFLALIGVPIVIATILGITISVFAPPPSKSRKINEKRSYDNAMLIMVCSSFYLSSVIIIPLLFIVFLFIAILIIPAAIGRLFLPKTNDKELLEEEYTKLKSEMKEMGIEV